MTPRLGFLILILIIALSALVAEKGWAEEQLPCEFLFETGDWIVLRCLKGDL